VKTGKKSGKNKNPTRGSLCLFRAARVHDYVLGVAETMRPRPIDIDQGMEIISYDSSEDHDEFEAVPQKVAPLTIDIPHVSFRSNSPEEAKTRKRKEEKKRKKKKKKQKKEKKKKAKANANFLFAD
jgi:hypothetical protein